MARSTACSLRKLRSSRWAVPRSRRTTTRVRPSPCGAGTATTVLRWDVPVNTRPAGAVRSPSSAARTAERGKPGCSPNLPSGRQSGYREPSPAGSGPARFPARSAGRGTGRPPTGHSWRIAHTCHKNGHTLVARRAAQGPYATTARRPRSSLMRAPSYREVRPARTPGSGRRFSSPPPPPPPVRPGPPRNLTGASRVRHRLVVPTSRSTPSSESTTRSAPASDSTWRLRSLRA